MPDARALFIRMGGVDDDTLDALVRAALAEDIGAGDATSEATVPYERHVSARVVAKGEGVLAGFPLFHRVFMTLDPNVFFSNILCDESRFAKGQVICRLGGRARVLLAGERTALNFLGHLSGIATETARLARLVEGKRVQILDTRKTLPLYRALEKYAVRMGGGANHRFGLYDMVLIKENHIAAAGGIALAVRRAREAAPSLKIEVETTNEQEVREALDAGADRIMLDNMDNAMIHGMVRLIDGRAETEASGNMNASRILELADSGLDCISVGAITQSAPAADFSMLIDA